MNVYISGPMRGKPLHNIPAFDAAAARIRCAGWTPVNPADLDRYANDGEDKESVEFIRRAMQRDTAIMFACDKVALLPGWRHSAGAMAEVALSCVIGLPALDAVSLDDITDDVREWWWALLERKAP